MLERPQDSAEETYKKLFEESPAPMYIFDHETHQFLAVNNAALYQYGYTKEEFLAMTVLQIRPAEDLHLFERINKNVPGSYYDFGRWRHIRKNGEIFYVHIYARTTEYMGKKARFVLSIDVDKKVRAEIELAEKNKENIDILESITDGFYTVNHKWEVTYFNKAAEHILLTKREEILGKVIWDFFPRSKEGRFFAEFQRAMTDKTSIHFEEYYEPLDLWVAMNVYPTKEGLTIYFEDITTQKKSRQKIYNDQQNLRTIINNTDDLIWSVDLEYNVISANNAFWNRIAAISGVLRPEKITVEMVGDEAFLLWQGYFDKAIQQGKYKVVVDNYYNGKPVIEESSFTPIYDQNKKVIGISCFSRDITEETLYLRQIEQQNEQLRQIAWIQSHEVRGPVASIMGLSALFDKQETNKTNAEIIEQIQQASLKLDDIIRKINSFTTPPDSTAP